MMLASARCRVPMQEEVERGASESEECSDLAVLVQRLMEVEIELFLCQKLQLLPLEVGGLLVPGRWGDKAHV